MDTLQTIYLICAALGGTLMIGQLLLTTLGLGGHHDVDADHELQGLGDHDAHTGDDGHADAHHESSQSATSWFLGMLTLRTLVAALTFFGLAGMAGHSKGLPGPQSAAIAAAAGLGAFFLVGYIMRGMYRLRAEGTAKIERAVGLSGTVYLKVPGHRAGAGKIQLSLQNRTVEYQAVTSQDDLPTGAKVVVVSVIGSDTVEVAPLALTEK